MTVVDFPDRRWLQSLVPILRALSKQHLAKEFVDLQVKDDRVYLFVPSLFVKLAIVGNDVTLLRCIAEAFGAKETIIEIAKNRSAAAPAAVR